MYTAPIYKLHFEPTSACNARCPQCPRTYGTSLETHPFLTIDEWSPDDLRTALSDDFFKDLKKVLINGNYGDIVMHTQPKELIEVFLNKNLVVEINTTGSALQSDFWAWLGSQPNVLVRFSIDGLADTHYLYRRNTRFLKIIENAKAYIDAGGNAIWVMTLFKHNSHQIAECNRIATDMGFSQFTTRESTRFFGKKQSIVDKHYEHSYYLEPYDEKNQVITEEIEYLDKEWYLDNKDKARVIATMRPHVAHADPVDCMVAAESSVYLSYDKRLWPCCYTAIGFDNACKTKLIYDNIAEIFKDDINHDYEFNNVLRHGISHIINDVKLFKKIEYSWDTQDVCTSCIMHCKTDSPIYKQYQTTNFSKISKN